jgi:hypothetical protein
MTGLLSSFAHDAPKFVRLFILSPSANAKDIRARLRTGRLIFPGIEKKLLTDRATAKLFNRPESKGVNQRPPERLIGWLGNGHKHPADRLKSRRHCRLIGRVEKRFEQQFSKDFAL